ncbi:MAG: tyrosine-type recombinase/integrase [Actinobacteria bacterium]|nr:tyrosine-type recombinase/integrase [Actinomycetota bacterium]
MEVAETVSEVTGHGLVYGPPKTYDRRSVPSPRALAEELGAHLRNRPQAPAEFVFTSPGGGPLRHHNFYRRHFKPALTAAGLPEHVRFHDMRHTCAALLINADPPAHPLAVMKRLGHSSITVTYNTYGHLFPALEESLTNSLNRSYRSAREAARPRHVRAMDPVSLSERASELR